MFFSIAKINVFGVFKGHYGTLGYGRRKWVKFTDFILFYILPFGIGLCYSIAQECDILMGIPAECWTAALTITSIFTPLTLSLLTGLFSLRDDLSRNPRAIILLREVTYNICYVIVVALILLCTVVTIRLVRAELSSTASGIFLVLLSHLMLTLLMVIMYLQ